MQYTTLSSLSTFSTVRDDVAVSLGDGQGMGSNIDPNLFAEGIEEARLM